MFSHVMLGANDLAVMTRFYDAVLAPMGLMRRAFHDDGGPAGACWVKPGQNLPEFFIQSPYNRTAATAGNGVMVAFLAADHETVNAAHMAGLLAGGTDEGAPGPRPRYGEGYYGGYLRDPEGNKVHLAYRGDVL
jgi:catechol 2,3-dioxygenase-like lactoylglutathione lyase family enzyme